MVGLDLNHFAFNWFLFFISFAGEPSKLDTVTGITTEDLEAELEMDPDNLKLDDIDTTDVNIYDEELLED